MIKQKYRVTVYDRTRVEPYFEINTRALWIAILYNYCFQRLMRFPKYTTVLYRFADNTVIHCKSDLY